MLNRLTVALLCLFFSAAEMSMAQQGLGATPKTLGIEWVAPESNKAAKKQLQYFSSLGFTYLQIDEKLSESVWNTISALNYRVYALLPVRFPVKQTFARADSSFKKRLKNRVQYYASHPSVKAIGLFAFSPVDNPSFKRVAFNFYRPLLKSSHLPAYFIESASRSVANNRLLALKVAPLNKPTLNAKAVIGRYLYTANKVSAKDIISLKKTLTAQDRYSPVFLNSNNLLQLIDLFPSLQKTFKQYTFISGDIILFPETEEIKSRKNSIIILILLLTWLILAVTYYISPVFRRSFYRYFFGHQFFVKDVLQRHTRTMLPGTSILTQHLLITGIVFFCVGSSLFSPLGKEALFYHFPFLFIFEAWEWSFLYWGIIVAFLLEALFIFWLRLANPQLTHMSQVFNLFPWVLQLNIFTATLVATLYAAGGSEILLYVLGIIFIVLFLTPFIITSTDIIRSLPQKARIPVTGFTVVLFAAILIAIALWIFFSPRFLNAVELAAML